jgi:hypothetical protein
MMRLPSATSYSMNSSLWRMKGTTMNQNRFADLTHALISLPSRREVLRGLAGAGFGLSLARLPHAAAAKKKRKRKKKKKATPNAFGCLNVGQPCQGDNAQCCSGICEGTKPKKGKPDKSQCVGHDASICTASSNICTTGVAAVCDATNLLCGCVLTTGNAPFCGDFTGGGDQLCRDCNQDTDCEEEFGAGAACVVFGGVCGELCPDTGRACVPACGGTIG